MTPIGIAALASREGRRLKAYRDSTGVWTCGIGHTSAAGAPQVTPGLTLTSAECDAIFTRDLAKYEATVDAAVRVPLADHERDALISLCYNIGQSAFARSSVVRFLNMGDRVGAGKAFLMWNRPPEVIDRRRGEADQFATPYSVSLPKARRSDRTPVKTPETPAPPAKAPEPTPKPAPKPATGLWARVRAAIGRKTG